MALRPQLPALCDKTASARGRLLEAWRPGRQCAAFRLENGGRWAQLILCYNAAGRPRTLTLPDGDWQVLADGENSFLWQAEPARLVAGRAEAAPGAALILGRI